MATRKRRPARPAAKRKPAARKKTPARKRPAARKKAAAPRAGARAARRAKPALHAERRRADPQSLRLRSIEPSLTVGDLERSVRFYTEALGFFVADRWTADGMLKGVMLKAGVCSIGLSQDDWSKGRDRQKGVGFSLWCSTAQDVDALAARIKSAGGGLVEEPKDQPWGGRSLTVDDPDGFRIRIYREA
jgi:predicted enzyme related to lactoylglutathione lyase